MTMKDFSGDNEAIHEEFESVPTNKSGNTPFNEVASEFLSRRQMLRGSLAGAVAAYFASNNLFAGSTTNSTAAGLVNFSPVTIADYAAQSDGGKEPVISADYDYQVLIPWGTPIKPGVPSYDGNPATRPTAAEQEDQIGIGHDGINSFVR